VDTQFANNFGFLYIDLSNKNVHAKLTGTFYDDEGSQMPYGFTIQKEIKNKSTETKQLAVKETTY
jgi:hypothetical protein